MLQTSLVEDLTWEVSLYELTLLTKDRAGRTAACHAHRNPSSNDLVDVVVQT